jgi:hypothetical protein
MSGPAQTDALYTLPEGPLGLRGPIARPQPGELPLRGDLAHIALAGTHLAAHYVIPTIAKMGGVDVTLKLAPMDDADDGVVLKAGSAAEVLDLAGDWVWLCAGPQGPAGYCRTSDLA